MEAFN
jgi:hypothetical protein